MEILVDPNITQAELLQELKNMTLSEILSVPLTGRFNGMFETFEEMGSCPVPQSLLQKKITEPVCHGKKEYGAIHIGNCELQPETGQPKTKAGENQESKMRTRWNGSIVKTGPLESDVNDTEHGLELSLLNRGTLWITQQAMNQSSRAEELRAA